MYQELHLPIEKQARIYTYGALSSQTQFLWIACHGYGQQAKRFVRKFQFLDPQKHFVICPEGLSRFYVKGFSGEVGASWMTKEDRLIEIEDYCNYLNKVWKNFTSKAPNAKIQLLGFSQGCATLCRWIYNQGNLPYDRLILWAGIIPEDLPWKTEAPKRFREQPIHFVYGTEDPFISEQRSQSFKVFAQNQNLHNLVYHPFEGSHKVDRKVFEQLCNTWNLL